MFLKTFLILLSCSLIAAAGTKTYHALDVNYKVREVSEEEAEALKIDSATLAVSSFIDNRNSSGWTYFAVMTNSFWPDLLQAYAAGFAEAAHNYELIWAAYQNRMQEIQRKGLSEIPQNVSDFIKKQTKWIESMVAANPTDPYWDLVASLMSQLKGMWEGYQAALWEKNRTDLTLTYDQFYLLTYQMDLPDVVSAFTSIDLHMPSCSFLLKLTDEGLFASHTTWGGYTQLLRTYKMINYTLSNSLVHNKRMSFASQPGSFSSLDDYYILDNNRVVTETTLESFNKDTFKFIHYDSLPYWLRVSLANLAFTDQQSWADTFYKYRSGTYNNQWLLIDFNNYNASKNDLSQAKNIIWMAEEFYNLTSARDVTQELLVAQGFVASYNVPYNATIQEISKNPTNYTTDPRYHLFQKYAPGIKSFEDFKNVMRMNNISDTGDYCEAIASRCDLNKRTTNPWGAFDCKVTNEKWVTDHQVWLISGPPADQNLLPFSWENWPDFHAFQMPRAFNFDWEFLDPERNFTYSNAESRKVIQALAW